MADDAQKGPRSRCFDDIGSKTRTSESKAAAAAAAASTSSTPVQRRQCPSRPSGTATEGSTPPPAAPAPTTMYISYDGQRADGHGAGAARSDEAGIHLVEGGWVYARCAAGAGGSRRTWRPPQAGRGREREGVGKADVQIGTLTAAERRASCSAYSRLSSSQRSSLPSSSWRRPCP